MAKTVTRYDVAEHLRTRRDGGLPEPAEEANGDAASSLKHWETLLVRKACRRLHVCWIIGESLYKVSPASERRI